jgi:hypothetical protein
MKYEHPSIVIDQPAAGHYVIYGHHPQPAKNEEGQTVVPLQQCYITREVPSDALIAILQERGGAVLLENGLSAQVLGVHGLPAQSRSAPVLTKGENTAQEEVAASGANLEGSSQGIGGAKKANRPTKAGAKGGRE